MPKTSKKQRTELRYLGSIYMLTGLVWLAVSLLYLMNLLSAVSPSIAGLPQDTSRLLITCGNLGSGLLIFLEGFLLRLAAEDRKKLTPIYIITTISLIIQIAALALNGFDYFFVTNGALHLLNLVLDLYIFYLLTKLRRVKY